MEGRFGAFQLNGSKLEWVEPVIKMSACQDVYELTRSKVVPRSSMSFVLYRMKDFLINGAKYVEGVGHV
jgi:hypothetical protein